MTLDAAAFEILERRRRFSRQTLEIARRRFLDGERVLDLAIAYGLKTQRIYDIEQQIRTAWAELRLPPGWVEVTVAVPKAMAKEIQRKAQLARKQLTRRGSHKASSRREPAD